MKLALLRVLRSAHALLLAQFHPTEVLAALNSLLTISRAIVSRYQERCRDCLSRVVHLSENWLYKKLSYRRGTARCVVSVEILPIAAQQCRNYTCTTSPEQIEVMKLEGKYAVIKFPVFHTLCAILV